MNCKHNDVQSKRRKSRARIPNLRKLEEDEIEFEAEVLTPGTHMRRAVDKGPDQVGGLEEQIGGVPEEVPVEGDQPAAPVVQPHEHVPLLMRRDARLIEDLPVQQEEPPAPILRRSARIQEQQAALMAKELSEDPKTYRQAMASARAQQWFKENGFGASDADPCLYIKRISKGANRMSIVVVVLWVDDLIVCGSDAQDIEKFKRAIMQRFNMKDLGPLSWILGMEIKRDRKARTLTMTQVNYIETMLKRFGMQDCRPVGAPAEGHLERDPQAGPDKEYMCLVGSLLYAAMITRPDIAYAVQALGRHMQGSNESHVQAGKKILRYLKGTKNYGLKYGGTEDGITLLGYADSDWASDRETREISDGLYFYLGRSGRELGESIAANSSALYI